LRDLVETTHVFLKLMEHMSKSKHIMVSKKSKRKKKSFEGYHLHVRIARGQRGQVGQHIVGLV
jgi:hypothetical protein